MAPENPLCIIYRRSSGLAERTILVRVSDDLPLVRLSIGVLSGALEANGQTRAENYETRSSAIVKGVGDMASRPSRRLSLPASSHGCPLAGSDSIQYDARDPQDKCARSPALYRNFSSPLNYSPLSLSRLHYNPLGSPIDRANFALAIENKREHDRKCKKRLKMKKKTIHRTRERN